MTYKEIAAMVASVGVPYAYYQFDEGTAKAPPFICFFYPGSDDMIADNTNYQAIRPLTIELYTDNKDFTLEATVEAILTENGIPFTRNEVFIDTERMYQITYFSEVVITPEQTEE